MQLSIFGMSVTPPTQTGFDSLTTSIHKKDFVIPSLECICWYLMTTSASNYQLQQNLSRELPQQSVQAQSMKTIFFKKYIFKINELKNVFNYLVKHMLLACL